MPFYLNMCFRTSKKRPRTSPAPPHIMNTYIDRISIIESVSSIARSHSNSSIGSGVAAKQETQARESIPVTIDPVLNGNRVGSEQPLVENSTASTSGEHIEYTRIPSFDQSENDTRSDESLMRDTTKFTSAVGMDLVPNSSLNESANASSSSLVAKYTVMSSSSAVDEIVVREVQLKSPDSAECSENVNSCLPNSSLTESANDSCSSLVAKYALMSSSSAVDENVAKEVLLKQSGSVECSEDVNCCPNISSLDESTNDSHSSLDLNTKYTLLSSSSAVEETAVKEVLLKQSNSVECGSHLINKKSSGDLMHVNSGEEQSLISLDPPIDYTCSSEDHMTATEITNADYMMLITKQEECPSSNDVSIFETSQSECSVDIIDLDIKPHPTIEPNHVSVVKIYDDIIKKVSFENPEHSTDVINVINNLNNMNESQCRSNEEGIRSWTIADDKLAEILRVANELIESISDDEANEDIRYIPSEAVQRPSVLKCDDNFSAGDSMLEEIKDRVDNLVSPNCEDAYQDCLKTMNYAPMAPETEIIGITLSNITKEENNRNKENSTEEMEATTATEYSGDYSPDSEATSKDMTCRIAEKLLHADDKTSELNKSTDIAEQNETDSQHMSNQVKNHSAKMKRPRNVLHSFLNLKSSMKHNSTNGSNTKSPLLDESLKRNSDFHSVVNTNLRDDLVEGTNLISSSSTQKTNYTESEYESQLLSSINTESSTIERTSNDSSSDNYRKNKKHVIVGDFLGSEPSYIEDVCDKKKEIRKMHKNKVIDQVIKSTQYINKGQTEVNRKYICPTETIQLDAIDKDVHSCLEEVVTQSIDNMKQVIPTDQSIGRNSIQCCDNTYLFQVHKNNCFFRRQIKQKIKNIIEHAIKYYKISKMVGFESFLSHDNLNTKRCDVNTDIIKRNKFHTCAANLIRQFNLKEKISDIPVDLGNDKEYVRVTTCNYTTDATARNINSKFEVSPQSEGYSNNDFKDFEISDITLELRKPATVKRSINDEVTAIKSKENNFTNLKNLRENKECVINLNHNKTEAAGKCNGDMMIMRDDTRYTSSPVTIHLTKKPAFLTKGLKSNLLDSQCHETTAVQSRSPLSLHISKLEERKRNVATYNRYKTEALEPMSGQKRTIPIKRSDSFEFTLSSLAKKFTTYVDPIGKKTQRHNKPGLRANTPPEKSRNEGIDSASNESKYTSKNSEFGYVYSPTNSKGYRRLRDGETVQHTSPTYKRMGKILDASKAIRSPKYSLTINPALPQGDQQTPKGLYFHSPKVILEEDNNGIGFKHETERRDQDVLNKKLLIDTFMQSATNGSNNQSKSSPENLKSLFDERFRRYAKKGKNTGDLISYKRSTEWLTDVGIVGGIITTEEANRIFKGTAGVKVALNKCDYQRFLQRLTRLKRINYNEIYERLCGIANELS